MQFSSYSGNFKKNTEGMTGSHALSGLDLFFSNNELISVIKTEYYHSVLKKNHRFYIVALDAFI